ncbi:MAG: nitroreductase family protein [Phycisphaerales bacterium]|nr:nitroreductase family protein [Phycisphaerales bacterium]
MNDDAPMIPYRPYMPSTDALSAARAFHEMIALRRSVRRFSDRPVPQTVIEEIIRAAGTAPSGANKQPWRFVAVQDPALKRKIRVTAEEEELAFYKDRAGETWLRDLDAIGTSWHKPFLETAPWLIAVFRLIRSDDGSQTYYTHESVGIAVGMLLVAAHNAGLGTLTHTPSPMRFLAELLGRPDNERAYMLIPIGYPTDDCTVPDIHRKSLDEIMVIDRAATRDQ